MSNPDSYRDQNGNHTQESAYNYGRDAANNGWTPPPQLPTETAREHEIRQQSYDWHKQNSGS